MRNKLFITIGVVVFVGIVYLGLNFYFVNKAENTIKEFLRKNNIQKDIVYKSVKANMFSGGIDIYTIKYYVRNAIDNTKKGYFDILKASFNGNSNKSYRVGLYDIRYISLGKTQPNLFNKVIFFIKSINVNIKKNGHLAYQFRLNVDHLLFNSSIVLNSISNDNVGLFKRVFKLKNPINIGVNYKVDEKEKRLTVINYSVFFKNNFRVSYSCIFNDFDFSSIVSSFANLKNTHNLNNMGVLSEEIFQIRPDRINVSLENLGAIDRLFELASKSSHELKDNIAKGFVNNLVLRYPQLDTFKSPVRNFLLAKNKILVLSLKAKRNISFGNLFIDLSRMSFMNVILKNFNLNIIN